MKLPWAGNAGGANMPAAVIRGLQATATGKRPIAARGAPKCPGLNA